VADYVPVNANGIAPFTATTAGAVTGGNVLIWSASGVVTVSGADSTAVCGVAGHDAASGARVTVWPIDGVVHELVASGAITALAGVVSDAAGQVKTATIATAAAAATLIGVAATTAAGSPLKLRVQGRR
jgi:hypothetical protein